MFDEIAETALEEERAIFSKNERYKQGTAFKKLVCTKCGKTGYVAAKCYLKHRKDVRVNKLEYEAQGRPTKIQGPGRGTLIATIAEKWATWLGTVKNLHMPKEICSYLKQEVKADRRTELTPALGQ
jgi:hypothetical protein